MAWVSRDGSPSPFPPRLCQSVDTALITSRMMEARDRTGGRPPVDECGAEKGGIAVGSRSERLKTTRESYHQKPEYDGRPGREFQVKRA